MKRSMDAQDDARGDDKRVRTEASALCFPHYSRHCDIFLFDQLVYHWLQVI